MPICRLGDESAACFFRDQVAICHREDQRATCFFGNQLALCHLQKEKICVFPCGTSVGISSTRRDGGIFPWGSITGR